MIRNRRHHRRVTAFISIMTRLDGREQYVSTTNVSAGGGFISSGDMPPLGADIDLHFRSARGPQAAIRVLAEVVRLHPMEHADVPGFAVRWRRGYCLHGQKPLREFLRAVLSIQEASIRGDDHGPCEFDFPQPALDPQEDDLRESSPGSGGDLRRAAERARADIAAARRRSSISGVPAPVRPRRRTERMAADARPSPRSASTEIDRSDIDNAEAVPAVLRSTSPGIFGELSEQEASPAQRVGKITDATHVAEQTTARARKETSPGLAMPNAAGHAPRATTGPTSELKGEALAQAIALSEEATIAIEDPAKEVANARAVLAADTTEGIAEAAAYDDVALEDADAADAPSSGAADAIKPEPVNAEASRAAVSESSPEVRPRPPTSLGDAERRRLRQSPASERISSPIRPRTPPPEPPPSGLRKLFTATSRLFGGRKQEEQPRLGRFAVTEDGRFYRPGEEEVEGDDN